MKYFLSFITFLIFNTLMSQSKVIETYYKSISDIKLLEERNDFILNIKEGTIIKKDIQHNKKNKYFIEFSHKYYDMDKTFYFVEYKTDLERHKNNSGSDDEIGLISIWYDKKGGRILGISEQFLEVGQIFIYLTKEGKNSKKFENFK